MQNDSFEKVFLYKIKIIWNLIRFGKKWISETVHTWEKVKKYVTFERYHKILHEKLN